MADHKDQDLNSFHSFMLRLQDGAINKMLTDALAKGVTEISDACASRGGRHEATITLKLKLSMDQKDKVVEVYPSVDEKHPKVPLGRAGMFFAGENGRLLRENPRQLTLEDEVARQRAAREQA